MNVEESVEFTPSPQTRDLITFNIFEDIAVARDALEKRKCGFQVVKTKKGKKMLTRFSEVAIVHWEIETKIKLR